MIGISACLLGHEVRYDGSHKRSDLIIEALGYRAQLVSVCPEVELGLGTPREPIRLQGDVTGRRADDALRMVAGTTDHTDAMRRWAERKVEELRALDLAGFIFMNRSPSCGVSEVKVYDRVGRLRGAGQGLFAQAVIARFPRLPVAEAERLRDRDGCEQFLERVVAYQRG